RSRVLRPGERARLTRAGNARSECFSVCPVVVRRQGFAAPGARLELARVRSLLGRVLLDTGQGSAGVIVGIWRALHAQPEAEGEAVIPPSLAVRGSQDFARTEQSGRPLKLLDREEAERVAH